MGVSPSIKEGERYLTNNCGYLTIVRYINANEIVVRFDDGSISTSSAGHIREGKVWNPNYPNICGVGCFGEGIYSHKTHPKLYSAYRNMLVRCYNDDFKNRNPTYIDCVVDKRWHNFQNFCADLSKMVGCEFEDWQLDKDILFRGNKIYSRDTCCLVPMDINTLLVKSDARRGNLCIGVHYNEKYSKTYLAQCSTSGKIIYLGCFPSEVEAFFVYKKFKENEISRRIEVYKDRLDTRVYDILSKYEVNPDD